MLQEGHGINEVTNKFKIKVGSVLLHFGNMLLEICLTAPRSSTFITIRNIPSTALVISCLLYSYVLIINNTNSRWIQNDKLSTSLCISYKR